MGRKIRYDIIMRICQSLQTGPKTARELCDLTGIPRMTVFRYLNRMKEKGIVIHYHGRGKYALNDPEGILELMRENLRADEFYKVLENSQLLIEALSMGPRCGAFKKIAIMEISSLMLSLGFIFIDTILSCLKTGDEGLRNALKDRMIHTTKAILDDSIKLALAYRRHKEIKALEASRKKLSKEIDEIIGEQLEILRHHVRRHGYRLEDLISEG